MIQNILLLFFLTFFSYSAEKPLTTMSQDSENNAEKVTLNLTVGEEKIIDLKFKTKQEYLRRSSADILKAELILVDGSDEQRISFIPQAVGSTTVSIWDEEGKARLIVSVIINSENLKRTEKELKGLLGDIEGLIIRIEGNKIILDGELLVPSDYGRVAAVVNSAAYQDIVMDITSISPISLSLLSKRIEQDIKNFAPNVSTRVVNSQIWLEGSVNNLAHAQQALRVAKLYMPEIIPPPLIKSAEGIREEIPARDLVVSFILVDPPPPKKQDKLVRVTFHFVELSKDYNKVFGFKWEPGLTQGGSIDVGVGAPGGSSAGGSGGNSFTAIISSLFPRLQSAHSAGFARILRTGTVIVRSGQAAEFNDRGKIPFTSFVGGVPNSSSETVGLAFSVTPLILGQSQDIQIDVNMSQTNLVGMSNNGEPYTAAHEVKTKIYIQNNESAAIAGLESSDVSTQFNKHPPFERTLQNTPGSSATGNERDLSESSPLFSLLRSKNSDRRKGQYVIFVTPQIVSSASEGTKDLRRNFRVKVN